nr:uncharacterized protein [Tanacetum cinerariifolium]
MNGFCSLPNRHPLRLIRLHALVFFWTSLLKKDILITRVYFVEGLGHNLFSVGQFYDFDLEVAFRRDACFIRNLEGVDLLKGDCSTNLYTINLNEIASTSPICLMARASSTKSWLWHQRDLARNDLVAVANHAEKPEKFNGQNFQRWQQKILFYLTTLNLARFLKETAPQVQDLQVLLYDIHVEGMTLSEAFKLSAIIEKLPPRLVEFKNYFKHKRKEMSVKDLVVCLLYKGKDKDKRKNDKKSKGKAEYLAPKAGIVKQKFQVTCYNCDRPGHRAANCKMSKPVTPRQANMVNDNMDMIAMVSDFIAMILEVNLADNGEKLYMGNSAIDDIKGKEDVIFEDSEKMIKSTKDTLKSKFDMKDIGYNDANWISDLKDSRSTSGYMFTLGGVAISWKSSKQTVIAKSTMEP